MAKGLTALAAILAIAILLTVATARLTVVSVERIVTPAEQRQEDFDRLRQAVAAGRLGDAAWNPVMGDAPAYVFVTWEAQLSSHCPLAAEWILLDVEPGSQDVCLVPEDPANIVGMGSGVVRATILAPASHEADARRVTARYYVFGSALETVVSR